MPSEDTLAAEVAKANAEYRPIAPVEPTNIRPLLFIDIARQMATEEDWPYRAVTVEMASHLVPGKAIFHGANHIDAIKGVHERRIDVSILNPMATLAMAHRGVGAFAEPHEVALIAVIPHHDQLGFAVRDDLGFQSLEEIAAARYPLKISTRGSLDVCTSAMIDVVLGAHGFNLAAIEEWGGEISYDQPMPPHPSRIGRLAAGEIDAIFDEGVFIWVDRLREAGASLLPLAPAKLDLLEAAGFRRGTIAAASYSSLAADVPAVDFSGWPIYCRADTSDALVERFCRILVAKRDELVWDIGGPVQEPMPLERMVVESPSTPLDVPFHPRAAAIWEEHGFIA
ncbi:MAG: hypothetical protein JST08_08670 [Actinobacteria bacterium]|nr:hypothetical protein [Actinomycetota bacterium]